jgi:Na+/melibiose symporter-like transporter
MWVRGIIGLLLCAVGALWIGQGVGSVHGSPMTGHSQYAVLGVVVAVVGLFLLLSAYRTYRRRRDDAE